MLTRRTLGAVLLALAAASVGFAQGELLRCGFDGDAAGVGEAGAIQPARVKGVSWVKGRTGQAMRVGAGGLCAYPAKGLFPRDTGQIEMWVQPSWVSHDGKRHALFTTRGRRIKLFKHTTGRLYLQAQVGRKVISMAGRVGWKPGEWHHVVVAWKGFAAKETPAVAALYVDGEQIAWGSVPSGAAYPAKTIWVGSDLNSRFPFDGAIDDFRILAAPTVSLKQQAVVSPDGTPTDDPYLATTKVLPPEAKPDPWHNLDRVRDTSWDGFPKDLAERYFGDSAAERVVYRDSVTGAEVWLLLRSPAAESISYTNYFPYNANGSLIRVWGLTGYIRADGSGFRSFREAIPHKFSGMPSWHKTDPDVVTCTTAEGGEFEYNLKTKKRRDLYLPDKDIRPGTKIHFSDDRKTSMFIRRQGGRRPFWFSVGDARGKSRREKPIRSASPKPEKDRMGSSAFLRDQHGTLYARYSLNKGSRSKEYPYQNWLVPLDGSPYRRMDSHNNPLDGTPLHFRPAGTYIVTGHGGYSPDMRYFVHHKGRSGYKWIRDLATWKQRDIAKIPGCDHMDWTVSGNWFFVWAKQKGVPIYKVYVDTGVCHRVVATNTCPHGYGSCPYHGSSPDGTKLAYKSSMLGDLDLYCAIVKYPEPPANPTARRVGPYVRITWEAPKRSKEIAAYCVYRSARSGLGYVRIGTTRGQSFTAPPTPGAPYYAVTSVEHSGLESRVFSNEVCAGSGGPPSVFWEAESGKLTYPMRECYLPAECSSNYALGRAVRDGVWRRTKGTGVAEWRAALPRVGGYALWARARSRRGSGPKATFTVNGRKVGVLSCDKPEWTWRKVASGIRTGSAPVRMEMPECGLEVDKLLLTADAGLTPTGMGNWPTESPSAPQALAAKWDKTRQFVLLDWPRPARGGVHHYNVYKSETPDVDLTQRNLIGSPTRPAFIDPRPKETGRIHYRVVAVNSWDRTSSPSATASVPGAKAAKKAFILRLGFADAKCSGKARVVKGKEPYLEFGDPKEIPQHGGEASIPVNLKPGKYYLWLRVKGSPLKSAAFYWVTFGKTKHYCRTRFASWSRNPTWAWKRVTFLKSVRNPQRRVMVYDVPGPTRLVLKHRANYMAVDGAFITDSEAALPTPDSGQVHPGCPVAFERKE